MLLSTARKLLLLWKRDELEECDGGVSLPEDLVIDILTRLPVKSLLRFKSVCKHWYTLIKSPKFINLHYHHENNPTDLVFHHCVDVASHRRRQIPGNVFSLCCGENIVRHQTFDYLRMLKNLGVAGPVNGLLLLIEDWTYKLELWNPAIREKRSISELNLNFPQHFFHCTSALGFGLDPLTHDCQVVFVQYLFDSTLHTVADVQINPALFVVVIGVYNLATDSWNLLDPDLAEFPHTILS